MSDEQKLHPIQIEGVKVRELFVRNNSIVEDTKELEGSFKFKVAHGKYDEDSSSINVGLIIELGNPDASADQSKAPIDLKVHLMARFNIDKDNFPIEKVEHWAQYNAPMILYPYAREHVYSLTGRVLSSPVILPLLQVPTLKL